MIEGLANPQYVASQYQNPANLDARIRLHQRFSTNKLGWQRWIFDQFGLPLECRLLELGCGTGDLWLENIDRVPVGWEIMLSDYSPEMLKYAQHRLIGSRYFRFCILDAQSIPFPSWSFEAVIANHMLYHLPDRVKAFTEIRRVLNPDGRFYASTNGEHHLQEIGELASRFDPQLASWLERQSNTFTLENGAEQLHPWFAQVTLHRYEDSLVVTEAAPLVDYILSGRVKLPAEQQPEFARFIQQELERSGGKLHITKDSGVFEMSDPFQGY